MSLQRYYLRSRSIRAKIKIIHTLDPFLFFFNDIILGRAVLKYLYPATDKYPRFSVAQQLYFSFSLS